MAHINSCYRCRLFEHGTQLHSRLARSHALLQNANGPRKLLTRSSVRLSSSFLHKESRVNDRARLSRLWVPTGGIASDVNEDSHARLIRAGFLRQAHPGIFHMLPLGSRVQEKLEALIDKHMSGLGASKLSLSSISSEELWAKSGRLSSATELFRFRDRKDAAYLLSPTHEEEITSLVSKTVKSYKELPIRLYQISRKYRDELRPRYGLLRSREFIMKDLYTFDYRPSQALETYNQVRQAYARFFNELNMPYLVAEADSGDMGGNLSHEFHFPTPKGEDHVISCTSCEYVANEELAESPALEKPDKTGDRTLSAAEDDPKSDGSQIVVPNREVWRGITRDRTTMINVWYTPAPLTNGKSEVNQHAVKAVLPDTDVSISNALPFLEDAASPKSGTKPVLKKILNLIDFRLPQISVKDFELNDSRILFRSISENEIDLEVETLYHDPRSGLPLNLLRIQNGDNCPRCNSGSLKVQKAIELGHTFHLGTRYSKPMMANVAVPTDLIERDGSEPTEQRPPSEPAPTQQVPMQMGCHGIGVSRIIAAVTDILADEKGLNWPRAIAPFEVVVLAGGREPGDAAFEVYDILSQTSPAKHANPLDIVVDDRDATLPWKLKDADLIGYPVLVVVGRRWKKESICEVQSRRLGVREDVPVGNLREFVDSLLARM